MDLAATLRHQMEEQGGTADPAALERLERHRDLLLRWNPRARLVSARDATENGLLRHLQDSVQALPWLRDAARVVDVGSGGGFPGLVWACLRPELDVVLVEAAGRKAAFLRQACRTLGCGGVQVVRERVQSPAHLAAMGGDLLTTRAAGQASLLLRAGSISKRDRLDLILYVSEATAAEWRRTPSRAYRIRSASPLASARPGRLLVLRRVLGSTPP